MGRKIWGKCAIVSVMTITIGIFASSSSVPAVQLINKTGKKTGYPPQTITVEVILGFDKSVYAHVDLPSGVSAPIKVPGIPGTVTLQYSRGDLMGNTDTRILQVPVTEDTRVIFYDDSYEILHAK